MTLIDPSEVRAMHGALTDVHRSFLRDERCLSDEIIDHYQIGNTTKYGCSRVAIPILNATGECEDVRCWLSPRRRTSGTAKILHWGQGYGDARLFPVEVLAKKEVVLVAGELDSLVLISHNIPALTATAGESTWPSRLSAQVASAGVERVTVLPDNDETGIRGAELRAASLHDHGLDVAIVSWPERAKGWDATDEVCEHGIASMCEILAKAQPWSPTEHSEATSAGSAGDVTGVPEFDWGVPEDLPDELPAVVPFDPETLPPRLLPWIADVVDRMQCPMDYPAIGALVTLAAVIGRQCGIRPLSRDDWTVIPNLWGAVVGRQGTMKSPALQETTQFIRALEDVARRQHKDDLTQYQADLEIAKATRDVRQKELRKTIQGNGDPPQLAVEIAAADPDAPKRTRYLLHDTTVEKIGEILAANPRGVLIFRDELTGFLRSLDKQGQEGARAFFLEAWNGSGDFSYDRIGRGTVDIDAACVSILGCIQPGPIGEYLRGIAKGGGSDDGLIQRFQLLVYPDHPKPWSHRDRSPNSNARNQARDVYDRLDQLSPETLHAEVDGGIPFLRFTSEALEAFVEWRTELETRVRSGIELPIMEAHLSKYRSLIPAMALIDHLVEVGSGPVAVSSFVRAAALGEYLESHARRIYAPLINPAPAVAKALVDRILSGHVSNGFSLRDNVYQKGWSRLATAADAQMAADVLESAAWICGFRRTTPGRTADVYFINPKILERVRG